MYKIAVLSAKIAEMTKLRTVPDPYADPSRIYSDLYTNSELMF